MLQPPLVVNIDASKCRAKPTPGLQAIVDDVIDELLEGGPCELLLAGENHVRYADDIHPRPGVQVPRAVRKGRAFGEVRMTVNDNTTTSGRCVARRSQVRVVLLVERVREAELLSEVP